MELDATADVAVEERPAGFGRVETYTVVHNREGEYRAVVIGRLLQGGGKRFVAVCDDVEVMRRMQRHDFLDAVVMVETDAKGVGRFTPQQQETPTLARL